MKQLLLVMMLVLLSPGIGRAAESLDDARQKKAELDKRIKDLELQIKAWDKKEAEHRREMEHATEYLKEKSHHYDYYVGVLEEIGSEIERAGQRARQEREDQLERARAFRERLRLFAVFQGSDPIAGRDRTPGHGLGDPDDVDELEGHGRRIGGRRTLLVRLEPSGSPAMLASQAAGAGVNPIDAEQQVEQRTV